MALMECIAHASSDCAAREDELMFWRSKEIEGELEAINRKEKEIMEMEKLKEELVKGNKIDVKKLSKILRIWKEREKTTHLLSWVLGNSPNDIV